MLGVGWSEMVVIAGVALLFVGPERLPRVMRELGKYYGQLRRAADDLRRAFTLEADRQDAAERYKALQERRSKAQEMRKLAEAERQAATGAVPQADATAALPEGTVASPPEDGPTPNDLSPEEPHPGPQRGPHAGPTPERRE